MPKEFGAAKVSPKSGPSQTLGESDLILRKKAQIETDRKQLAEPKNTMKCP
jgi:hypothetical protein